MIYSMALTARQQAIYDFILQFRREQGCSPSIPEIQRAFGIKSPNGVAGHLKALAAKGAVGKSDRGSRQIEPLLNGARLPNPCSVPLFGEIPAGPPQEIAAARAEGCVMVDAETLGFAPKEGCYALKVRGDSMKDAGILPGDLVVVQPTPSPQPGQIVVALIDGESTLKRLLRVKGRWFLKAENPAYPELVPRGDLVIQGAVRTVIRRLE